MQKPGGRLGSYELLEVIGRGGMAEVWRAKAPNGQLVALKVMARDLAESDRFVERFQREARAGKALDHPNVVRVLDAGEERGQYFMALELVTGGSLSSRLRTRGPLPWKEAVGTALGIARGLAAAHEAGLVHRDLKPENVLIDGSGRPKVADFGLVRNDPSSSSGTVALTRASEILGSFPYMAPEQAENPVVDGRADLYSFGATLFALLTGRPPFLGEGLQLVKQHLASAPPAPSSLVPEIPAAVDDLVHRLLAKKPEERGTTAGLVHDLEVLAGVRKGRRRGLRALFVLALLVVVGGMGFAGWVLPRQGPAPPPPPAPKPVRPPPPGKVELPRQTAGFRETARTRLVSVHGDYRWRHSRWVKAVAATPDGKIGLSGGWDDKVLLWDLATGDEIGFLGTHSLSVNTIAVAPGGKLAVTGSDDSKIRVFSVPSGHHLLTLEGHVGTVRAVALSPDGRRLVSGGEDGKVRIWDLDRAELIRVLEGHASPVNAVAFSPDGKRVASGAGPDHYVPLGENSIGPDIGCRVWNVETGEPTVIYPGYGTRWAVGFQPESDLVLAAGHNDTGLWGKALLEMALPLQKTGLVRSAAFLSKTELVTGHHDGGQGVIKVWNTTTGQIVRTLPGHRGGVDAVAPFLGGKRLISCGGDLAVRVWDLAARDAPAGHGDPPAEAVVALAPVAGGKLACALQGGAVRVLELATGHEVRRFPPAGATDEASVLAVARDGESVLVGMTSGSLDQWSLRDGKRIRSLTGHSSPITAVAISPEGTEALSGSLAEKPKGGGEVVLWDLDKGVERSRRPHDDAIQSVGFLDNAAKQVFTVAGHPDEHGSKLLVWDRGLARARINWPLQHFHDLALMPDGSTLLLRFTLVVVLRPVPGQALWRVRHNEADGNWTQAIAVSPDGQLGVSSGIDRTIRVFATATGEQLDRINLASSTDFATSLAFVGPRRFIAGTERGVVLTFDVTDAR